MQAVSFTVTIPADARYLKALRGFFEPLLHELFAAKAHLVILALDESCSNVVKHRRPCLDGDQLTVRAEVHDGRIAFHIGNFCRKEDVPHIKPRDLADVRPGGLGTHFIGSIMDKVEFVPEQGRPGRMALVLEKALPKERA